LLWSPVNYHKLQADRVFWALTGLFSPRRYAPPQPVEEIEQDRNAPDGFLPLGPVGIQNNGEAFPIWRQVICRDRANGQRVHLGPHVGLAGYEGIAFRRVGDNHDPPVRSAKEELAPVARPHRESSASSRNQQSSGRAREPSHVNLERSRLIRGICEPAAVRRKWRPSRP